MKNLNIITSESIGTRNYLGQGIHLGGQHIDFLVSQGFTDEQKSTLVQGSFLIALKTRVYEHVIGFPQLELLNTDLIYLLRVSKSKGVPDESSHLFNLSKVIIDNRIQSLAPP